MENENNIFDEKILKDLLIKHESYKSFPYADSKGYLTIGIGHNLSLNGLTDNIIEKIYEQDVDLICIKPLDKYFPKWRTLDGIRQIALIDLCFNIGITHLKNGHPLFMQDLLSMNYESAAQHLENSSYKNYVGTRCNDLCKIFRTGKIE